MRPLLVPFVIVGAKYDEFQVRINIRIFCGKQGVLSKIKNFPAGTWAWEEEDRLPGAEVFCTLSRGNTAVLQV